jgi:hypothetical protein
MSYSKLDQGNEHSPNDVGQFMEVRSLKPENQPQREQHNQDTDYENGPYYFHGSKSKHQFPSNGILLLHWIGNLCCGLAVDKLRNDNQNRNNGN